MTERVSIIEGKKPIILVAPHGFDADDERTALITEYIAKSIKCYAVVNRGWERADDVDIFRDKADCNNANHCHEDVVREEFLDPIIRFRNRLIRNHDSIYMYLIHGMSNKHRIITGDSRLDMVIGFGAGSPDSYSCDPWRKDCFIDLLGDIGINAYEGKKGGPMSGWARNNMNQLFRKWHLDYTVQSMQIEIIHDLRKDNDIAQVTGDYLSIAMTDMLTKRTFAGYRKNKQY